jgi:uncharacterized protein (DUF58 family)
MSPLDLPPDLRSRLRRLSLTPRRAATLVDHGMHASRNRGGSMEFAQYRAYERGDDLRRIDWKLYSRSDRFFVRDAERESPVAIWIVLDASASMAQADLATPDWSRFDAAKRVAASLIEVALNQGDRFGLIVATADGPLAQAPASDRRDRDRALLTLAPLRAGGIVQWARDLAVFGGRIAASDMVVMLSDGFDEACIAAAERLAASGRDVSFVQILTADERDFPFDRGFRFQDPESQAQVVGDGRSLRGDFLTRFVAARAALAARLTASGVRHVEHFVDEGADLPILALSRAAARR